MRQRRCRFRLRADVSRRSELAFPFRGRFAHHGERSDDRRGHSNDDRDGEDATGDLESVIPRSCARSHCAWTQAPTDAKTLRLHGAAVQLLPIASMKRWLFVLLVSCRGCDEKPVSIETPVFQDVAMPDAAEATVQSKPLSDATRLRTVPRSGFSAF